MPTDHAARWSATATRSALGVLAPAVARAARNVVDTVAKQTEAGYLAEAAHDVRAVRTDAGLGAELRRIDGNARTLVMQFARDAMADGYRATMEAEAPRVGLAFSWSEADASALAGHPIVDATAGEWAVFLADRLLWRVRGVATRGALGAIRTEAIPGQVAATGTAWADEVGRLVGDAYHAGIGAARAAMARAISDAGAGPRP